MEDKVLFGDCRLAASIVDMKPRIGIRREICPELNVIKTELHNDHPARCIRLMVGGKIAYSTSKAWLMLKLMDQSEKQTTP